VYHYGGRPLLNAFRFFFAAPFTLIPFDAIHAARARRACSLCPMPSRSLIALSAWRMDGSIMNVNSVRFDTIESYSVLYNSSRTRFVIAVGVRRFHVVAKLQKSIDDRIRVLAASGCIRKAHVVSFKLPQVEEQRVSIYARDQQTAHA